MVTVDLLTTGVDIPDLECLVFLRPVKSRIFVRADAWARNASGRAVPQQVALHGVRLLRRHTNWVLPAVYRHPAEAPEPLSRTLKEIIEDIWNNRDRGYNTRCLVRRLQRIDKEMAAEARPLFAAFVPDGDLGRFARALPRMLEQDFVATMTLLRKPEFHDLLMNYPRPERTFLKAVEYAGTVTSTGRVKDFRPEDYLAAFARFVRENATHVESLRILLGRRVPRRAAGNLPRPIRVELGVPPNKAPSCRDRSSA